MTEFNRNIMKKISIFVLLILSLSSVSAQNSDLSPWSFTAEYGLSSLDGDGDSYIKQAFGAGAEYEFLPFAGVSVGYYHFPLAGAAFSTALNTAEVNLTLNINRLIFGRKDDKVILKGYLGYGLASYSTTYTSSSLAHLTSYSMASSFPVVGLSVEFPVVENFSMGLKSQFRPFNKNNLEGDPRYNLDNVTNDNLVALTLFLRVKLYAAN